MAHLQGKLSLIMPAYNEGERIFENLHLALEQVLPLADEVELIVVDDGSSDDTLQEIRRAAQTEPRIRAIHSPRNEGKGNALRLGTAAATGTYIAFCDADLDLAPAQLDRFIEILQAEDADAVIGSKMHPQSHVDYPLIRRVYSICYYLLLKVLFRLDTKDTQTGLKLFRAPVIKPVMRCILVKRYAFDIEVLALIRHNHGKICSAPVDLVFHRVAGGRIKWRDIYRMLWDTAAVFYRLRILHYYDAHHLSQTEQEEEVLCNNESCFSSSAPRQN